MVLDLPVPWTWKGVVLWRDKVLVIVLVIAHHIHAFDCIFDHKLVKTYDFVQIFSKICATSKTCANNFHVKMCAMSNHMPNHAFCHEYRVDYGVTTISRLLKIIGSFCRIYITL